MISKFLLFKQTSIKETMTNHDRNAEFISQFTEGMMGKKTLVPQDSKKR